MGLLGTTTTGSSLQVARPAADFFHLLPRRKARPCAPTWPERALAFFPPRCPCFSPAFPATSLQRLQCPLRNHFPSAITRGADPQPAEPCSNPCDPLHARSSQHSPSHHVPLQLQSSRTAHTERDLLPTTLAVCFLVVGRKKHTGLSRCRSVVPF